ncbi:FAD-binding oxidoreductase, partial [Sphingomonas sp.]|uniref:NAD(P)/FAD-dependent oxidoreductase n=1 Tax=Sphingomonas sp. TaxID=28214 RepID=UPI00286E231E
ETPLAQRMPMLVHARADELDALEQLRQEILPFAVPAQLDAAGVAELCPLLRTGPSGAVAGIVDRNGLRLDPHALLQGYQRQLRSAGANLVLDARAHRIHRGGGRWEIETERGDRFAAPLLVNAAGAWADAIAALAGVAPLSLAPLKRTIITFDPPPGTDLAGWPFAKTVADELYFAPEGDRLFASPMDEVPSDPCDAQPDEYEVALAAHRIEERLAMRVERVIHRWAGLRTFAPDRRLVAGFAPDSDGFFWLAGQGGFGLQTAPAMARIAQSLIAGTPWPIADVAAGDLAPGRFLREAAEVDPTRADQGE